MAISKVNPVVSSSIDASSLTVPTANNVYGSQLELTPAIYTITCNSGVVAKVEFMNSTTNIVATATTSSGVATIELTSSINRVRIWTNTGINTVVTITKTANGLTNNVTTGDLVTLSSGSGTYTGTSISGYAYVVIVGGGGGGAGNSGSGASGLAGGSGQVIEAIVPLTGSMSYSIGTGGAAGGPGSAGTAGTNTTFGSNIATAGAGGTVVGGYNDAGGGYLTTKWTFITTVIGQGGHKNGYGTQDGTYSGYGAGGCGVGSSGAGSYAGLAGRPGVIYIKPIN